MYLPLINNLVIPPLIYKNEALLPSSSCHPPYTDFKYACSRRCRKKPTKKVCVRVCKICCKKCHCVPPGAYGHKSACPCDAKLKTHGHKLKCP
ncbi:hypothetical protein V6Z11_D09G136200 [Gossypium hirsutum]